MQRWTRWVLVGILILVVAALAIWQLRRVETKVPAPEVAVDGDLMIEDLVVGSGAVAQAGNTVAIHYRGFLENGTPFDSSWDRSQPYTFRLGFRVVIKGWDEGIEGMRVGGRRRLTIAPPLAYGAAGSGGVVPPNATLTYEIELLSVE